MNLSPARLIVLVALVVGGVAVLLNGFGDDADLAAVGGTSPSPSVVLSPSPSPSSASPTAAANTPEPEVEGVTFAVFNGTTAIGLAAEVEQMLESEGYVVGQPAANAPTPGSVAKTTVYYRGGDDAAQAESNATNMATEFLDGAAVKLLGADFEQAVPEDTQLVVVIGNDYPGVAT